MDLNSFDQSICQSKYFQTTLMPNQPHAFTQPLHKNNLAKAYKTYEPEQKLSYYSHATPDYTTTDHGHHAIITQHNNNNLNNYNHNLNNNINNNNNMNNNHHNNMNNNNHHNNIHHHNNNYNNYNQNNNILNNGLKARSPRVTKAATLEANDKPFKCIMPGCVKSYKNPNGLKYHNEHGHRSMLSEAEEKKPVVKPFRCLFSECDKRYKNPNGLKYHLEHAHNHAMIHNRG